MTTTIPPRPGTRPQPSLPPGLHPPVWQDWAATPAEALVRYLCTALAVAERTLGRLPEPGDFEPGSADA